VSNYYFTSADVGLSMYFLSGGSVVYPKRLFMFGLDTAEVAEDLYTASGGNVQVITPTTSSTTNSVKPSSSALPTWVAAAVAVIVVLALVIASLMIKRRKP
jgi:hypothetical protein